MADDSIVERLRNPDENWRLLIFDALAEIESLRTRLEIADTAIEQKDIYTAGVVEERDALDKRIKALSRSIVRCCDRETAQFIFDAALPAISETKG